MKENGNVKYWQYLTGKEFKEIDKSKTVVMVTCSPVEVHGPHLPVITDNWEAEGIATWTIGKMSIKHPEILFLRLPPLYVAADVLPQTGSLMFRNSTIIRVLSDLGRTLSKQGFRNIWVASFHGGPRHFVAIEHACHKTNKKYGARMVSLFSLLIRLLTEGTPDLSKVLGNVEGINPDDLVGDTHAGLVETSMMLRLMGNRVDPMYKNLPRQTVDLKLMMDGMGPRAHRVGRSSIFDLMRGFKAALMYFKDQNYSGAPQGASAEIGDRILDVLSSHCVDALSKLWAGEISLEECHSPVWRFRWIFLIPMISRVFEWAVGYKNPIF